MTGILNVFNITVTIDGHTVCQTCHGRGLVANTSPRVHGQRRNAMICPTCHRYRHQPIITITGIIPDTNHHATPTTNGYPFALQLGG